MGKRDRSEDCPMSEVHNDTDGSLKARCIATTTVIAVGLSVLCPFLTNVVDDTMPFEYFHLKPKASQDLHKSPQQQQEQGGFAPTATGRPAADHDGIGDSTSSATEIRTTASPTLTTPMEFSFPDKPEGTVLDDEDLAHCPMRTDESQVSLTGRCIPASRRCRRMVADDLFNLAVEKVLGSDGTPEQEGDVIEGLAEMLDHVLDALGKGGGAGGPSLMDINKGILSQQTSFVDLHVLTQRIVKAQKEGKAPADYRAWFSVYSPLQYLNVVRRIHRVVTLYYLAPNSDLLISGSKEEQDDFYRQHRHVLNVAAPTFFSRISSAPAVTPNDEYWHKHVDTEQYGSFAVTTLLYLNSQKLDADPESEMGTDGFTGGSFVFGEPHNFTVHPKKGRLSSFTSGHENPHWVEKVSSGRRYALTSAFTCALGNGEIPGVGKVESFPLFRDPNEGSILSKGQPRFLEKLFRIIGLEYPEE